MAIPECKSRRKKKPELEDWNLHEVSIVGNTRNRKTLEDTGDEVMGGRATNNVDVSFSGKGDGLFGD